MRLMKLPHTTLLLVAAIAVALPPFSRAVAAQAYPSRPITVIVPYAAGGPTDAVARILAERMRTALGQPIIIENVSGATGSIGVGRAVRAPADGYTVLAGTLTSNVFTGALYALRYDLLADLRPVALLADGPFILVARKTMAASDLKQLMAWLKANPDKASQGTGGFGAAEHLAALLLQQQTGLRFQIVPYRGNSPAVQDLVGAQIDIMFADGAVGLPNLRAGLIKAYAVTAKNRLTAAPDIPTVDEVGLPGFYASLWYGLWAPARTSQEVVAKLNAAAADALADATVRARLVDLGFEIFPREQQKPAALAALQKAEIEKWWPIIKEFGIKGE